MQLTRHPNNYTEYVFLEIDIMSNTKSKTDQAALSKPSK